MTAASMLIVTRADAGWDRSLLSLREQTRLADQTVVVIDRPTSAGERADFTRSYPEVEFVFNDANLGIPRSTNRGLAVCRGVYVFRSDDDDFSRADRIEKQLAALEASGADLMFSWATGKMEGEERPERAWTIRCPTGDGDLKAALEKRNLLVHSSLAFRRAPIEALGGYDETFRFALDYAFYLAAARAGLKFAAIPEPLVERIYMRNSVTLGKRHRQLMFSAAARIVHCAYDGDVLQFLNIVVRYSILALTPNVLRSWRRRLFLLIGRGA